MTFRKRKFARTSFVILCLLAPLAAWRIWITHEVNRQLAAIRAAGLPANGEELDQWYPAVPAARNAALVLTEAFKLRRNYPDNRSNFIHQFKMPGTREQLTVEQEELLQGYVAMNAEMLAKADEALKLPDSRYPIDCTMLQETELPHLAWLRDLAQIHQYTAALAIKSDDVGGVSSNIVAMLALGHTLDNEPVLISQLVRLSLMKMAVATLERRANAGALNAAEIERVAEAFGQVNTSNLIYRALVGERAMTIPYFRMSRAEITKLRASRNDRESKSESPLPYNGPAILRLVGYYELDFASYLYAMDRALGYASRSPPANRAADRYFAHVGEESTKRNRTLAGLLLSAYAGAMSREAEGVAYPRMALVALAVEQFRNETGRLPETLDELVRRLLLQVPEDPYDGKLLRYRKLDKGYVVYSVGKDQVDDGGREKPERQVMSSDFDYDLTFTVER